MGLQYRRLWFIRYCTWDVELICLEQSSLLPGNSPGLRMRIVLLRGQAESYFEESFVERVSGKKLLSVMADKC
jgi:hypothetical protein